MKTRQKEWRARRGASVFIWGNQVRLRSVSEIEKEPREGNLQPRSWQLLPRIAAAIPVSILALFYDDAQNNSFGGVVSACFNRSLAGSRGGGTLHVWETPFFSNWRRKNTYSSSYSGAQTDKRRVFLLGNARRGNNFPAAHWGEADLRGVCIVCEKGLLVFGLRMPHPELLWLCGKVIASTLRNHWRVERSDRNVLRQIIPFIIEAGKWSQRWRFSIWTKDNQVQPAWR